MVVCSLLVCSNMYQHYELEMSHVSLYLGESASYVLSTHESVTNVSTWKHETMFLSFHQFIPCFVTLLTIIIIVGTTSISITSIISTSIISIITCMLYPVTLVL